MEDWSDILIPILMFAVPVVAAVVDARRKKKRGRPQVVSHPVVFESDDSPLKAPGAEEGVAAVAHKHRAPVQRRHPAAPVVSLEDPVEEGQKTVEPERSREAIDKKKLIIYSEILKPKFDE